ncbi:MAG TPA: SNF2-related protein, partial [Polyangiaceae bacterium]|nr:SNF2-related protein [Polyangiaceae bacterium]
GGVVAFAEAAPSDGEAAADAPAREAGADPDAPAPPIGETAGIVPWRETPDPERVAPALAWLEQLGATPVDRRVAGGAPPEAPATEGWWVRLNARSAERLDALWRERPVGVEWFGNRAARELLEGGRRVRARLSVTATGLDWLSVRAEWESEGLALTDADLAKLRAARETFVRLAGGWVRRDEAEAHDQLASALADLGLEAGGGEQRLSAWQLAQARPESLGVLAQAGADGETLAAVTRIRQAAAAFTGLPRIEVPKGFRGELRPYQRDGLDFLAWTSSTGLGAVLADDMGLGKTVQTLVWLEHLRERDPHGGPALVVCPASVMHNWEREAARFVPGLRVLALGSGRERRARLREAHAYDLVITNYALLRRDLEHWRSVELRAAVLDEAQNVKNPDAAVSRATLELRARHRLALTGTPLENRALDLWSILAFVNPGGLGPRGRFVQRYDRPDAPPHLRRLLAARLRPVLLRRLKEQVERDLPARIEERLDCELTPGQRKLYLAELVRARQLLRPAIESPESLARKRIVILAVLTQLRQICCHPALAGGERALGSGKFDALFELLEPLRAEGQKVLVFSQFVRCLDLIADALRRRGLPYHTLTGQTSTARREQVVRDFAEDPQPCVFLVSLKAGGTGLNLTAANHVVLFDPWWNPAVEAQAIDRTHRIGQTRAVVAYRLYAEGTIEERIEELQRRKAQLARDVLGEDGFARSLTREDLAYLLAE